jgi:hypothetical protein
METFLTEGNTCSCVLGDAPGVLAEAAHKTGRAKVDFELREISREEYERIKSLLL